jgi:hypothetical protein
VLKDWIRDTTKKFKFLVTHEPMYTNDINHYPGRTDLRYLFDLGLSGFICGHSHNMERFNINGVPLYICGTGGSSLRTLVAPSMQIPAAFSLSGSFGYLHLTSDPLTTKFTFKDTQGNVLDESSVYA